MSTLTALTELSQTAAYRERAADLPLLHEVAIRYADERPFAGLRVVCGHVLVVNTLAAMRVLAIGGAEVIFCDPFPSPVTQKVASQLRAHRIPVLPVDDAVNEADLFLDVTAVLGRRRLPRGAAEISRSGEHFYRDQASVTVTVDSAQVKKIETFFGIGDGMLRAWGMMKPDVPVAGLHVVLFGYGKVGRGVAHLLRGAQAQVTVVELMGANRALADSEGFETRLPVADSGLAASISRADVVVAATGVPNTVAACVPVAWLDRADPVLVSLSAVDEFGAAISPERVLGGKGKPLNFHLDSPTTNRYVDPSLAAHLLALEEVIHRGAELGPGLHVLSNAADQWLLSRWREQWPDEDLDSALKSRPGEPKNLTEGDLTEVNRA